MYPQAAVDQRVEGNVLLHVIIAGDGTVKEVSLISGPALLAQSAIESVKQWRYQPVRLNGIPLEVDTTVTIQYALGPPPAVTVDNQPLGGPGFAVQPPPPVSTNSTKLGSSAPGEVRETCEVPFVATHYDASSDSQPVVSGLKPGDFSARVGNVPTIVTSAAIDSGPKRIGVVIDASRNIPDEEWEREIELAANFIEHARPGDSLSIFLAGVDSSPRPVTSPAASAAELRKLMFPHPSTADSTERNYDALFAVARSMEPPQFGDTLFLFGHPDDVGSKVSAEELQDVILKHKARLIIMSFSNTSLGMSPKLDNLTRETGYFISHHDMLSLDSQPDQIPLMEEYMGDLYGWIAGPYRLEIEAPVAQGASDLTISLADAAKRGIRGYEIHYPRKIYPCSAAPAVSSPYPK